MPGIRDGDSPSPQDPTEVKLLLGPESHEVTVNRAALQSMSSVFKNMLSHNMAERIKGEVRMEWVSIDSWKVISAFYFSRKDLVSMDNVEALVHIVDMYDMTELKDRCDDFLCQNAGGVIEDADCLDLANTMRLTKLREKYMEIARRDFEGFSQSESFLKLSRDVLLEILCSPYLMCDEHVVCLAVVRLLEAQNVDRQTAVQLLQHVKLNEVCLSCLGECMMECQNVVVRDVLLQLVVEEKRKRGRGSVGSFPLQYFAFLDGHGRVRYRFPNKFGKPFGQRCKCAYPEANELILIGGENNSECSMKISSLNVDNTWSVPTIISTSWAMCHVGICLCKDFLVVVNEDAHFYNINTQVWMGGSPLQEKRTHHGMVAVGDVVYAVMGCDSRSVFSSVETCSLDRRVWSVVGDMPTPTHSVSAAAVGSLIIARGFSSKDEAFLQYFNTLTGASAILNSTPESSGVQWDFSFGPTGAAFVQNDEIILVHTNSEGVPIIAMEKMPDLRGAFEVNEGSCRGTKKVQSKRRMAEKEEIAQTHTRQTYFVQHSPNGGRANLIPFPSLPYKLTRWIFRF